MELDKYIIELSNLKPSQELLIKQGFTPDNIIMKNYVLDKNTSSDTGSINGDGMIFSLFRNYNTWYIRFADFTFYKELKKNNGLFVFAGSSYSELAFKATTSEVIEYDREKWSVLNYCAKNTEAFMEALLPIFELYSLRVQGLVDVDDINLNSAILNRSSRLAGGEMYRKFYSEIVS